jgi:SAM-dependent methyltransferase
MYHSVIPSFSMLYAPQIYSKAGFTRDSFKKGDQAFLDVGCGVRKLPGAVGVDADPNSKADIIHNLESFPWPLKDASFDVILLSHVLEHLSDTERTLKEVRRVAKPGAHIVIQVPYFRSPDAFADPTHKHFFTILSETFIVIPGFEKKGFWIGWPHPSGNPLKELFKKTIHAYPRFYENTLSVFIPAECLTWELEVTA